MQMDIVALLMVGGLINYLGNRAEYIFYIFKNLLKIKPISNNNHIGIANKIWEITSGGVNTMPIRKAKNIT